ncbi:MAG: hypothetical protein ACLFWL_12095 [Candidatus Brocadiia bacterium]
MKKAAFVAFFGLLVSVSSAAQPGPSLLFCSPRGLAAGYVDLTYIKELHDAGFEVDYTEGLDKLTADRIRQYNVLVLYTCPNKQLAKRILKYVAGGGGILLIPTEHNINKQRLYDITEPLGADLPVERIKETDPVKKGLLSHGARGVPLAYTFQIPPSPVSKGVKGIWYPTSPAYNASHTGPLAVGKPWLVVLRGSKTSKTVPVNLSESNTPDLLDPFIREAGVKEPVFFAIRPFKKGRVVLVAEDTEGHSAVSTPRRCWKSGGRAVVFCGDHVNDCKSGGMILGRGPVSLISHWVVPLPPDIAGNTWDGGPPGSLPLVTFGESRPVLVSD